MEPLRSNDFIIVFTWSQMDYRYLLFEMEAHTILRKRNGKSGLGLTVSVKTLAAIMY